MALAPFLLSPTSNGIVYIVVGLAMPVAGAIVLRENCYLLLHLLAAWHNTTMSGTVKNDVVGDSVHVDTPSSRWTILHGFIAGFGGFSLPMKKDGLASCSLYPASQTETRN